LSLRFGDIGIATGRVIGIQLRNAGIVECGRLAWIDTLIASARSLIGWRGKLVNELLFRRKQFHR
jgi:hypothetical protein